MRLVALLAVLVLLACAPEPRPRPEPAPDSRRRVDQGELVGYVGGYGSHVWAGIPFAAPPRGALRWRAPVRPESWTGVREAVAFGAVCPQLASPLGGVDAEPGTLVGSEDCLTLNVYAPRMAPGALPAVGERLPVLFWIHGGGNVIGHAGLYDGGYLARTHGVVVVTTQYRLGALGWLRHASLRAGDDVSADDASGNFGTLDLIRALAWVRRNIAAFGGDPDNVTIFGESAGAHDVFTLLLSPRAEGLFHRAIAQSGGTDLAEPAEAEHFADDPAAPGSPLSSNEIAARLLRLEGRVETREQAKAVLAAMPAGELAALLRATPVERLFEAYRAEADGADPAETGLIRLPRVFADGHVLPGGDPLVHFAAGRWNVVPVIVGTNRDENKLFMFNDPRWVRRWLGFLPRLLDPEAYDLTAAWLSALWKADGADEPAAAMRAVSPAVWAYRFDWDEEPTRLGTDLSRMLGAAHAFEIPFVFGHFDLGRRSGALFDESNRAGRETLATQMQSYWVQFARTGDPGRGRDGDLPRWQAWQRAEGAPKFLVLDTPADGGLRMSADAVTRALLTERLETDPRLREREDRCELLAEITRWSELDTPAGC